MNSDEAMAEIRTTGTQLGACWWNGEKERWEIGCVPFISEHAKSYLTGCLHEWFTGIQRTENNADLCYAIDLCCGETGFLPALWQAYKAVHKIEVG